jgi:long-chain acyl-CoA synthetase
VHPPPGRFAPPSDWLLALITQIAGEAPPGTADELRLAEDLNLDSLGRVQLAAAIEQKLGMPPESGLLERVQTLGDLRKLLAARDESSLRAPSHILPTQSRSEDVQVDVTGGAERRAAIAEDMISSSGVYAPAREAAQRNYIYPTWPWIRPIQWMRLVFLELVMRPLVWFLADPRTEVMDAHLAARGTALRPMLIVANHVTSYDGPLVQSALPARVRRRIAVAMSGEMLEDYRHFRNPEYGRKHGRFYLFGPIAYFLLTVLFNVFPLPRNRNFQRSFAHAGEALDHGFHVMIFPEGTRSASGELAQFRPGIGLLVKQSNAPVLPVAIRGLGELKKRGRGWFRSGTIEVRVGQPIQFPIEATEATITERLHREVETLLEGAR